MIHHLRQTQDIPAPIERVWAYFATPDNLDDMTPPAMRFRIIAGRTDRMIEGQLIEYRIRLAPLVWTTWLTEIRRVEEGRLFVDEQRFGPYRLWHHEHRFEALPGGGVRMTDHVTYILPFGPVGDLVHALWVGRTVRGIFAYRRQRVAAVFGT